MRATAQNLKIRVACWLGAAVAVMGFSATSAFAAPSLFPTSFGTHWACDVDATLGAPPVESSGNGGSLSTTSVEQEPVHELAQLTVPLNGQGITGTLFHDAAESCTVAVTAGQVVLNSSGVGTLSLTLNIPTTPDDQGDMPCSALFGGQTSLVESFRAVFSLSQGQLLLVGEENYFPIGGAEAIVPVRGACIHQ